MRAIPERESDERRIHRFPLPPHPIAAEQARRLTKIALEDWGIPEPADNALLIVTELTTNATKMGEVFHFSLTRTGATVLIEVWDGSEAVPDPRRREVERVDGRGLLLVDACAKEWGWRLEEQGGKTVWAIAGEDELAAPSGAGR